MLLKDPNDRRRSAIISISAKISCAPQTLNEQVKKDDRLRALERENRDLKQANEFLRKAPAYFTQAEFDRRHN